MQDEGGRTSAKLGMAGGSVRLRCWGARGSIPSPGPDTMRYGGNTPCVELLAGDRRLIFDAGTGLRLLGTQMLASDLPPRSQIFLTHFHWDHIQGFPFFAPLYDPTIQITIIGPEQEAISIEKLFARQMGPIYFPVPFSAVSATTSFVHLNVGDWVEEGLRVRSFRTRHDSYVVGYRVEVNGVSVCYIPDNELGGGSYPVDGGNWREDLRAFVSGADLLIHDAMYTTEEYESRNGWGHSTFEQARALAADAGVDRLLFFHHAPGRSDDELDRIVEEEQTRAAAEGGPEVSAAREGEYINIERSGPTLGESPSKRESVTP